MKLQRVPKWLCNHGTGRTHRLRYTRRQKLENVYRPVSYYLCGACEGPFSRGSPHMYSTYSSYSTYIQYIQYICTVHTVHIVQHA